MKKGTNQADYIDYFQLENPLTRFKSIVSNKARVKMYRHFVSLANPTDHDTVLDMGVTPNVSLFESNFFEKLYPFTHNITMSSIEDASHLEQLFAGAKFVQNSAGARFPFVDKQFDILFCSAVLEHVGDDDAQRFFLQECMRVAKKVYLTTPDKHFPIEFHTYLPFIHYLPQHIHQSILRRLKMDFWAKTENLNLLNAQKLLSMVPNDRLISIKVFHNRLLGMSTNLILYFEQ